MPSNRVHCAVSRERTTFNFQELHKWIDEDKKKQGVNHRVNRHTYNLKEANVIEKYWEKEKGKGWGKKAVTEWLFHIAIDNLETAFKSANKAYRGNNAYNFFKFALLPDSRYLYFDFDRLDDDGINKEFEDSYKTE